MKVMRQTCVLLRKGLANTVHLCWVQCGPALITSVRRQRKQLAGLLLGVMIFLVVRLATIGTPTYGSDQLLVNDVGHVPTVPINGVHQMIRTFLVPPYVESSPSSSQQPDAILLTPTSVNRNRRRRVKPHNKRGNKLNLASLHRDGDYSQHGQSKLVDNWLHSRRNGFYIESGASDGETGSNSLFFELKRNWNGLLVEANPASFSLLQKKRRHAWALRACLSPTGNTTTVQFQPAGGIGGIVDQMPVGHRKLVDRYGHNNVNVTCFALADIIAALPISPPLQRIDYWSLDVEGAELPILHSINWTTMIPIDTISIEYKIKDASGRTDKSATETKLLTLRSFFANTGLYEELGTLKGVDVIFCRKSRKSTKALYVASNPDKIIKNNEANGQNGKGENSNKSGKNAAEEEEKEKVEVDDIEKDGDAVDYGNKENEADNPGDEVNDGESQN